MKKIVAVLCMGITVLAVLGGLMLGASLDELLAAVLMPLAVCLFLARQNAGEYAEKEIDLKKSEQNAAENKESSGGLNCPEQEYARYREQNAAENKESSGGLNCPEQEYGRYSEQNAAENKESAGGLNRPEQKYNRYNEQNAAENKESSGGLYCPEQKYNKYSEQYAAENKNGANGLNLPGTNEADMRKMEIMHECGEED